MSKADGYSPWWLVGFFVLCIAVLGGTAPYVWRSSPAPIPADQELADLRAESKYLKEEIGRLTSEVENWKNTSKVLYDKLMTERGY